MTQSILGIDVSKATLDVTFINSTKKTNQKFENSQVGHKQLDAWMRKQAPGLAHVCLEATGKYGDDIAAFMFQQGHSVSVVNPARIKFYGNSKLRRNKTDKADAELIAEYCERQKPALWSPPPASFKDLQALVRHLEDLQETRLQEINRLNSGVLTPTVIYSLENIIDFLDHQIKDCKVSIQKHIDRFPELKSRQNLLVTIPGIGWLTAAKILGEVRDILDFESARQLAAYAGLTPRNFLSGTSVHKKCRISKTGNTNLRKALYMPAIVAKKWNPIVAHFCSRISQNGLKSKEVIVAAMRKLLHIIYGVLKSGRPFDPHYLDKSTLPS